MQVALSIARRARSISIRLADLRARTYVGIRQIKIFILKCPRVRRNKYKMLEFEFIIGELIILRRPDLFQLMTTDNTL